MRFEFVARAAQISKYAGWFWLVLALGAAALFWPRMFPLDDAYITLHNSRVLISGQSDPVYGTSYLTGATSLIHLMCVSFSGLVFGPLWGSFLVGLAGASLYFVALIRIADRAGADGIRKLALILVGGFFGNSIIHYLNGLETALAMAAAAWMLIWCDDRRLLPAMAGIAFFIRPELGLLGAILLARLAPQSGLRATVGMGILAAACAFPWMLWSWIETGRLVPSTIGAKLAYSYVEPMSLTTRLFETATHVSYLPLFVGFAGLWSAPAGRFAGLFIVAVLGVVALTIPNSIATNFGRYSAIFAPVLFLGLATMGARRKLVLDALLGTLVVLTAITFAHGFEMYQRAISFFRSAEEPLRFVGTLPPRSVVLIHDAGLIAWESPNTRLVDIVGLKTPAIVSINKRLIVAACDRSKPLDHIARTYGATHLVNLNRWEWPCVAQSMQKAGWTLRPVHEGVYTTYELSQPGR